jgi:RNA polymerase sigma factor (sigma-70 family)
MATALLIEPKSRLRNRSSRSRSARRVVERNHAQLRAERKLDRQIEYIDSDWTRINQLEMANTEGADSRRLTADEEANLFRRMNFLKHRAERLRELLSDDYCPQETVDAIAQLLDESTHLRNYLVQVFSKLAVSVARQYANTSFRLDELLSEAHVTLLRCVEIFDIDRGYRFSTYATNAIRHNLNRYVTRQHRLRQTTREYVPTDGLVSEPVENPHHREREYSARMSGVSRWLGELDPREQTILRSRYGLTDDPGKVTLQSLADQLGLSRERIRQLEIRAIEKLRALASQACPELERA